MTREVDVKALISHIVRGDGADKCRICMGDTSEGQVYLGDTVMMDGERPITLAELVEVITGVEVEFDGDLPQGLCQSCSNSAVAAVNFKQLCKESHNQWIQATTFISNIEPPSEDDKAYYIFYNTESEIKGPKLKVVKKKDTFIHIDLESDYVSDNHPPAIEYKTVNRKAGKLRRIMRKWTCPDCGKTLINALHLNSHLKSSTKRACDICGLFFSKSTLPGHMLNAHLKIVYYCQSCYQMFEDKCSLVIHVEKCHGENSQQCKVCGNGYNNIRALNAHMYSHTVFFCPCGKSYKNRNCFVYHQKQCKKRPLLPSPLSNEYICDHCGNSYTKKPSLRIHIIQKHLNVLPYVCAVCGKRTSTVAHLRSHEKVHKLERKVFQCHCGAKMRTELGYQLHLRIHSGEKPYQCEQCGDKFLSASRRLDHIKRRHRPTKDMPHGCKECSARFIRPFELRKHYVSVHPHTIKSVYSYSKE